MGPCPSFTTVPLPTALLLANTWQEAQGLQSARTASCRFPGTGCTSSSEGLVGSVTFLAGILRRRSFPAVQTHLADKRGFESLQTHSVARSCSGATAGISVKAQALGSGCPAQENCPLPGTAQATESRGRDTFCSSKFITFLCVCVYPCMHIAGRAVREKDIKACQK